ncbi:hypothetical protein A2U01_0102099, partial [Trifolium medium]|nr:hypothetical protein [Trifolium medium]
MLGGSDKNGGYLESKVERWRSVGFLSKNVRDEPHGDYG